MIHRDANQRLNDTDAMGVWWQGTRQQQRTTQASASLYTTIYRALHYTLERDCITQPYQCNTYSDRTGHDFIRSKGEWTHHKTNQVHTLVIHTCFS